MANNEKKTKREILKEHIKSNRDRTILKNSYTFSDDTEIVTELEAVKELIAKRRRIKWKERL